MSQSLQLGSLYLKLSAQHSSLSLTLPQQTNQFRLLQEHIPQLVHWQHETEWAYAGFETSSLLLKFMPLVGVSIGAGLEHLS